MTRVAWTELPGLTALEIPGYLGGVAAGLGVSSVTQLWLGVDLPDPPYWAFVWLLVGSLLAFRSSRRRFGRHAIRLSFRHGLPTGLISAGFLLIALSFLQLLLFEDRAAAASIADRGACLATMGVGLVLMLMGRGQQRRASEALGRWLEHSDRVAG